MYSNFEKNSVSSLKRMKLNSDYHPSPSKPYLTLSQVDESAEFEDKDNQHQAKGLKSFTPSQ